VVIDWTVIGAPPPTGTSPTVIRRVWRRSNAAVTCKASPPRARQRSIDSNPGNSTLGAARLSARPSMLVSTLVSRLVSVLVSRLDGSRLIG
jgi:hypothetical protein